MSKNTIVIIEYVSAGGFNQTEIPSSLFCEGFAMLKTLIEDFYNLDFEIHALLDERISYLSNYLKVIEVQLVGKKDNFFFKFKELLDRTEYCFIIAPEFSNILHELTNIAKQSHSRILSMGLEGIVLGTSKYNTYQFFLKKGILTPKTWLLPFQEKNLEKKQVLQKAFELNGSLIVKPEDGVGAESIHYFKNAADFRKRYDHFINQKDSKRNYVLQEFIKGQDLSASLIGFSKFTPALLSINTQFINFDKKGGSSEYLGGRTPINKFEEVKKELVQINPLLNNVNLLGYFGLDFILDRKKHLSFIEINPRLTTSYIGVRNVINKNPVQIILDAKLNRDGPPDIQRMHHSTFLRVELITTREMDIMELREQLLPDLSKKIPEIITPPIHLTHSHSEKNWSFSTFIATKANNERNSKKRLNEIMRELDQAGFKRIN